jgi:transcriptional regulator with XRE-family HTH domain
MRSRNERQPKRGRPTVLTGTLLALSRAVGGIPQLASALGVAHKTLLRWEHGESPASVESRIRIRALAIQHGVHVEARYRLPRDVERGLEAIVYASEK